MANEITLNLSALIVNGNYRDTFDVNGQIVIDQANAGADGGIVEIATAETTISLTRLTTEGLLFMRNLDGTNFIEFGPDSGGSMVAIGKLKPGEIALFRLKPGVTLKAQADTAACDLYVKCLED